MFLKNKDIKNLKYFNVDLLEKRLKKAKRDKPWNAKLFNQIGNFWRIKGDAGKSIDCFRSALIMDPSNADVLHNLGRVLFTLQYLDDAIFLTRRSLEAQPNNRNIWRQYFTLGEIYKEYGQFQQSILHFRHALELYPDPIIIEAIRKLEEESPSPVHMYTMLIISVLVSVIIRYFDQSIAFIFIFILFSFKFQVVVVLVVILSTTDFYSTYTETVEMKPQRHFNRAMAMKSLKGFVPRSSKSRNKN